MSPPEATPEKISVRHETILFFVHFSLTILVATTTIFLIEPPSGNKVYNLVHRRPRFLDADLGEKVVAGIGAYKPLQSDIITALDIAASATRAAAAWWSGNLLWHCAFIFMEKGDITTPKGFSKVVNGHVTTRLSPSDVSKRKNVFLVYLIIFTCFVMDFFSSILTGSVTWEPALIYVSGFEPIVNITEGLAGADISSYRNQPVVVSDAADLGACLALVPWENTNSNAYRLPLPSNRTRRAIIQNTDVQIIQYVSVGSPLDTIRLPYFKVENFEYLTNPTITLTSQQKSLLTDSNVYNPYLLNRGFAAFLPDTAWGPGSNTNLPSPTTVSESRILGILVERPAAPTCTTFPESIIPLNVDSYLTTIPNSTLYSCFVFANVTYTAGAAICRDCQIVSPAVIEGDIYGENLQPVPDSLTIEALALAPAVGTQIWRTFFASPIGNDSTSRQNAAIESVSQAYQSAWSSLVVTLGGVGPDNQTSVAFAIPASRPSIRHWRVYLWAGLHIGVLFCGIAFVVWRDKFKWQLWVPDPVAATLQFGMPEVPKQGEAANPKDPEGP